MSEDDDLAFALFLQEQFNNESSNDTKIAQTNQKLPTSIVDEAWEMIDPVPDIRQMFLQFNEAYFWGQLASVEVRWSPKMTLCAGLCCYEGRGGLCSIRLSEPLLKLRPRKDLVQTLLHEMIHALLFVTQNNKDHDGHGPEFHKHMYRINKATGTNITVYHNFHDEVDVYRQHWWKCNGPCQNRPPFYGVVKRSMNRAPAPRDTWWAEHQAKCGGTFSKVKEPDNYKKKKTKSKDNNSETKAKAGTSGLAKNKTKDNGTPNLPSLFERIKKKNNATNNGETTSQVTINSSGTPALPKLASFDTENSSLVNSSSTSGSHVDIKELSNGSIKESSDCENENASKRRKTEDPASHIVPFSGKGYVLGARNKANDKDSHSGSEGNIRVKRSKQDKIMLDKKTSEKTKGSIAPKEKNTSTGKSARKTSILTIEDAFKQAEKTESVQSPSGSCSKPITVLDSPVSLQTVRNNVTCPVCQKEMPEAMVNQHLDSCLL